MVVAVARYCRRTSRRYCFQQSVDAEAYGFPLARCLCRSDSRQQCDSRLVGGFDHRYDRVLPLGDLRRLYHRSHGAVEA